MSLCSSMITKQSTPMKSRDNKGITDEEEISLIESISSLIEDIKNKNKSKKNKSKKTIFYCEDSKIPKTSIFSFIFYIYSYLNLDFSKILLSLISIKRLLSRTRDELSKNNFYKLFLTSCLLNSKQNEDHSYDSNIFAIIGKIDINELVLLEKEYFSMIDYKLFVNEEVYQRYYDFIKKRIVKANKKISFNSI